MKIAVLIKQVPDTETKIRIQADASGIMTDGIKYVVSPYDEFAVEEAIKGDDKADIEAKNTALMEASQKLGEKIYANQSADGAAAGGCGADCSDAACDGKHAADDDVVDAEVKEVKKD